MTSREQGGDFNLQGVNPDYARIQIAKAFTTNSQHEDPLVREQALEKIAKWETVLKGILSGSIQHGSRTPISGVPSWITLEVVTGGFATGSYVASGPLREHEKELLAKINVVQESTDRRALNAYYLSDEGLADLENYLLTGCYDIETPEEGALLVIAWLAKNGRTEEARQLVDEVSPFFDRLRFYPIPSAQSRPFGSSVHLQDVAATIGNLRSIQPNKQVLAQKVATTIWIPLYDRMVALFLETSENGMPCRHYAIDWSARALGVLHEYSVLQSKHALCKKMENPKKHYAQLRNLLRKCAESPKLLNASDVSRVHAILNCYVAKRGAPNSQACMAIRQRQANDVRGPTFQSLAEVVIERLKEQPQDDGLHDVRPLQQPITELEATTHKVPVGTLIPESIQFKVERCLKETIAVLVKRGLVTSGDMVARLLPQMTSRVRAMGIADPTLRQLYSAIYRAFRHRRSLLLLNLERQVQLNELPWIRAIERLRTTSVSNQIVAREAIEEVVALVLNAFPYAIIPNKLLQELRSLDASAGTKIPLIEELAVDIFMGQFSSKFVAAAQIASELLAGKLYAKYYDISFDEVSKLQPGKSRFVWPWKKTNDAGITFAQYCAIRADVVFGVWSTGSNGMIIEQQQILTTQNLASLFAMLHLDVVRRGQLLEMATQCFRWVCKRLQVKTTRRHAELIALKNSAYAWRQMIFFLSFLSEKDQLSFVLWAESHLQNQTESFRTRFRPALRGLALAVEGKSLGNGTTQDLNARRFLGWSTETHWLSSKNKNNKT